MTSPLHRVWTPHPEKGVDPIQDLFLSLTTILILAQAAAAGATPTIMCLMMTASQADPSSVVTHIPRMMMMGITIVAKRSKRTPK
jgi:hypothetical protein